MIYPYFINNLYNKICDYLQITIWAFLSPVFSNNNNLFRVYIHEAVIHQFGGQVYEDCEYYELLSKNLWFENL